MLLPVGCLLRRADSAGVIGQALALAAAGLGHRTVAERLGRPAATVRGWLRRAIARAGPLRSAFTALLCGLDPDPLLPARPDRRWPMRWPRSWRPRGRQYGAGDGGVRVVAVGAGLGGHRGRLAGPGHDGGAGQHELPLVSRAASGHPSVRTINTPRIEGSKK